MVAKALAGTLGQRDKRHIKLKTIIYLDASASLDSRYV